MAGLALDFEKVEVLNIVGLHGHRHLNHPLDQLELARNDYGNGILRYQRRTPDHGSHLFVNNFRVLVRVVVKAHHKEVLRRVPDSRGQEEGVLADACHLLVFENWLGNPSEDAFGFAKSEEEYLGLSTLRAWRLVDVDGSFGGNSYYRSASAIQLK